MVPPNTTTGRAPGRGRRPEDAPTPPWGQPAASRPEPAPAPEQAVPAAPAGLPEALAAAVLNPQAPPTAKPKAPAAPAPRTEQPADPAPAAPAPAPERGQGAKPTAPPSPKEASKEAATSTDVPDTPPETTKETALVAVTESRSAADAARAITWLGVTFRPPDVWRERQPSLKEEWEFVMDGSHLPEQGLWRAAARGYAAPAIAVITALHVLIWVLRSPARHATAWAVLALVAGSAAFML
ncbi:hypothetical protein SUDANB121_05900 (plasmid) [Nocardiopsis dassonvillei]|uniref:hypothetical protein n=1 Tax=Nocardiopsis dassonvillei TaxID=2014 RepID=UPI003F56DFC6